MEEFLTENGIPVDSNNGQNRTQQRDSEDTPNSNGQDVENSGLCLPQGPMGSDHHMLAGPSRTPNPHGSNQMRASMVPHHPRSPSPCGSASSGISHDMGSDTSPESSQAAGKGDGDFLCCSGTTLVIEQ